MSVDSTALSQDAGLIHVRERVAVEVRNGEYCLVALRRIAPGERIITIEGDLSTTSCRLSVQVGRNLHIAPPKGLEDGSQRNTHLWRFLNHSCRPNAIIVRRVLVAIKPVETGEEISFDYNTTEWEMASPFRCRCGHCDGDEIRGYRFLSPAGRAHRENLVDAYLCEGLQDA